MREGGRAAAVGGVRKSGLVNGAEVYAKPLLQYWNLYGQFIIQPYLRLHAIHRVGYQDWGMLP